MLGTWVTHVNNSQRSSASDETNLHGWLACQAAHVHVSEPKVLGDENGLLFTEEDKAARAVDGVVARGAGVACACNSTSDRRPSLGRTASTTAGWSSRIRSLAGPVSDVDTRSVKGRSRCIGWVCSVSGGTAKRSSLSYSSSLARGVLGTDCFVLLRILFVLLP